MVFLWYNVGSFCGSKHAGYVWVDRELTALFLQRLGLDVEVIECRWGDGADEDKLQDILSKDKDKKIKAVAVVHNETTTGVTSEIGKVLPAWGLASIACMPVVTAQQRLPAACGLHA